MISLCAQREGREDKVSADLNTGGCSWLVWLLQHRRLPRPSREDARRVEVRFHDSVEVRGEFGTSSYASTLWAHADKSVRSGFLDFHQRGKGTFSSETSRLSSS